MTSGNNQSGQEYSCVICPAPHMTNIKLGKEEELATKTETERKKAEWPGNYVFKLAEMDNVPYFLYLFL